MLDRVLGAWLHTRAVQAGGRLVIAIDGKSVRSAKGKTGKAPHLVAALACRVGALPVQPGHEVLPGQLRRRDPGQQLPGPVATIPLPYQLRDASAVQDCSGWDMETRECHEFMAEGAPDNEPSRIVPAQLRGPSSRVPAGQPASAASSTAARLSTVGHALRLATVAPSPSSTRTVCAVAMPKSMPTSRL